MSKKKLTDEEKIEILQEKIIDTKFDKITAESDIKLIKIMKKLVPYSNFYDQYEKYYDKKLNEFKMDEIKEMYKNIILGVSSKKILIKNIINFKYNNADLEYYVEFIKNNNLKMIELKLFLIEINYNKGYIIKDINEKLGYYNLDVKYYVKADLEKLEDYEAKIVYYVINHEICYEDFVLKS